MNSTPTSLLPVHHGIKAKRLASGSLGLGRIALGAFMLSLVGSAGCGREKSPEDPLALAVGKPQDAAEASPAPSGVVPVTKLAIYHIKMEPASQARMEQTVHSNDAYPATFTAGDEIFDGIKVRYRGAFARSWPKKPIKIFFDKAKPFQGGVRLNLNSAWRDPAFVREHLAYHIYTACGAPASKTRMVQLEWNGAFRGLYVEVEQPDKAFLQRHGLRGGAIYKAFSGSNMADERDLGNEAAYRQHYEKETQTAEGFGDLIQFCRQLARTTNTHDFFSRHVDLEKYINYLAASTLVQNWDAYNKNHFIVHDGRGTGKWFAVPWDLDRTLGDHWDWSFDESDLPILLGTQRLPGPTGWNRLQERFFSDPALRSRFLRRLSHLLDTEFTPEKLFPMVDQLESQLAAAASLDRRRWGGPPDFRRGIAELKTFITKRRASLKKQLNQLQ
jgi:spore coat protein H